MHKKLTENKAYAQKMSRLRSSTVEPVLGTLINFLNMKRVNTRGIDLANKHVMMSALTYNLKKYLKFISKKAISKAIAVQIEVSSIFSICFSVFCSFSGHLSSYFWRLKIINKNPIIL